MTTETTAPKTLPDKPSELIRVALRDLEACELDGRYAIDMAYWHEQTTIHPRQCAVCFAGAVMAKTLNASPDDDSGTPSLLFDPPISDKLCALNELRCGNVRSALGLMGIADRLGVPSCVEVYDYEDSHEGFKRDMRQLADRLEEAGL